MGKLADAITDRRKASCTTLWPAYCSECGKEEMYVQYYLDGRSECEKCWIRKQTEKKV